MMLKTLGFFVVISELAHASFSGSLSTHLENQAVASAAEDHKAFANYVHDYNKTYVSKEEYKLRLEAFVKNRAKVNVNNFLEK